LVGIFNPIFDKRVLIQLGTINISCGWISFFSIVLRFILTVSAAIILVSLAGFNAVCSALEKLGVPEPFVVQLLFFYRYLFILGDEFGRVVRASFFRAVNKRTVSFSIFISIVSNLLLRTFDRAERIYCAMCSRGFDGHIRLIRSMKLTYVEVIFMFGWIFLFILFRSTNFPLKLGVFITGHLR